MWYVVEIAMDNAAFAPDPRHEVARMLRALAARVSNQPDMGAVGDTICLRDVNGNTVGVAETRERVSGGSSRRTDGEQVRS